MRYAGRNWPTPTISARSFVCVVGTRPEVIKMAPIIRRLRQSSWATVHVVTTGQQDDLLENSLADFDIRPDFALKHRKSATTPAVLLSQLIRRLDHLLGQVQPDGLIAQGDTTSVLAASVAAFYRKVPFVHVEAGLRTGDLDAPFPEEFHRRAIATSAFLHCAPTIGAAEHLLKENVPEDRIIVSGNTVIDSLLDIAAQKPRPPFDPAGQKVLLLTAHRRENFGDGLRNAFMAIRAFVDISPDVVVYFPVHPNPNARQTAYEIFSNHPRIHLVEPFGYRDMVAAIQHSWCVITDSGGLQEEAPALGKPVLVLRDVTERPEAVATGVVELVGTSRSRVFKGLSDLYLNERRYNQMARAIFPYGDGHASERIAAELFGRFRVNRSDSSSAEIIPLMKAKQSR